MVRKSECGGAILSGRGVVEHYETALEIAIEDFLDRAQMAQVAKADDIRPLFHDPRNVVLLAVDQQYRLVGGAVMVIVKHNATTRQDAEIAWFYMRSDVPHKALMQLLLKSMDEEARGKGCESIIGVTSRPELLQRFESYGYPAVATVVRKVL